MNYGCLGWFVIVMLFGLIRGRDQVLFFLNPIWIRALGPSVFCMLIFFFFFIMLYYFLSTKEQIPPRKKLKFFLIGWKKEVEVEVDLTNVLFSYIIKSKTSNPIEHRLCTFSYPILTISLSLVSTKP